ncbi:MAG TPA: alpha/beta fold hydrolase [Stellaceae bacterium]|nr:alpha/beta fold hydrolase [Stellaceae bacterium]
MARTGNPDRRLAPRPLPAHLASAMLLWLSSRAALPALRHVSLPSSRRGSRLGKRFAALSRKIDELGLLPVARALDRAIAADAEAYLDGLEAYRRHPYRRARTAAVVRWRAGTTRLLDYGAAGAAIPVLVVPSLINRFHVLDLLPQRSFLRHLAAAGLRPLVVDWGAPGEAERGFGLDDYIAGRLDAAFEAAAAIAGEPLAVLGYCMGGLLALALALRRQTRIAGLVLLATPWDFHAERAEQARLLGALADRLSVCCGAADAWPIELIQMLFFILDPFLAQRKFRRFAQFDPAADEARSFVALEDWINDGVPLAAALARECARSWYGDNEPGRGVWRVAGDLVRPAAFARPSLVVLPARDRIVPPGSAAALAAELDGATLLRPPLGHVGMMAAARAPELLWRPVAQWLAGLSRAA